MSGVVGHVTYAMLAAKAAEARGLPIAPLVMRNYSAYLAGSYLGCDIQTLPAAVCVDTGIPVGYGSTPIERSPITGGELRPWRLTVEGKSYTPKDIHEIFYGRSHLILGWSKPDAGQTIQWADYLDYAADVAGDAMEIFGPGERPLAYVLGWMTHVSGDGLIKSVLDGVNLNLLGAKYSAKNRPVQDLVTWHEIGQKELGWNWPALLADLAASPVEAVQAHYMRCAPKSGRLGAHFHGGWQPDLLPLLREVMRENRRHQRRRNKTIQEDLKLVKGKEGTWDCRPDLSAQTGGLTYEEMVEEAERANFRHALWQIGELVCDLFERVIDRQERLQDLPSGAGPDWSVLTERWGKV